MTALTTQSPQTRLHEMFADLYFPARGVFGRRLPFKTDQHGKVVCGPWRHYSGDGEQRIGVLAELHHNYVTQHISGVLTQGPHPAALMAYQVDQDGMAVATGIDLDVAGEGHAHVAHHFANREKALNAACKLRGAAEELALRSWLEITKSGGYRVMVFHERVPADHAQALGHLLLKQAGLSSKIEVFPKQTIPSLTGNGLHLPYWGPNTEKGRQVMLDWDTQEIIPLGDFVLAAWDGRIPPERLAEIVDSARKQGTLKSPAMRRQPREGSQDGDNALHNADNAPSAWQAQLRGCAALRGIVERMEGGAAAGYEEWLRLATHLRAYGEWGRAEFHRLSAFDPRYDAAQADELMDSLTGGPTVCDKMTCGRDPQRDCGLPAGNVCSIALAYRALPQQSNVAVASWAADWTFRLCVPDPSGPWRVSNQGVGRLEKDLDGELRLVVVLAHPLHIKSRAYDVDTQEESVTVVWLRDGEWKEATVPQTLVADSRSILALAARGCLVNSHNARDLVGYIAHLLAFQADNIPLETIVSTTGHKRVRGHDVYMHGRNVITTTDAAPHVSFSAEADTGAILDALTTQGDLDAWIGLVKRLGEHPIAAFVMMAGFLAPVVRDLKLTQNPIIDLAGRSSCGKTTLLRLVASIWGYPPENGGLIKSWNATPVYIERLAQLTGDLPIFLDESHTVRPDQVQATIYQYANGTGRGRGAKEGGVQKQASYRGVLFSAGEVRLADASQHDGAQARILGFWGSPFGGSPQGSLVAEINQVAHAHYGIAGPQWVATYMYQRDTLLPKMLAAKDAALQRLSAQSTGDGISARLAALCAAVEAVGRCVSKLYDLDWDVPAIVDNVFALLTANRKVSSAQASLELIGSWIASKPRAVLESHERGGTQERDVIGKYLDDDDDPRVALLPSALKETLARHDYQYTSTVSMWSDNGWLDGDKDRASRTTRTIRFAGDLRKMVVLSKAGWRVARGLDATASEDELEEVPIGPTSTAAPAHVPCEDQENIWQGVDVREPSW